MTLKAIPHSRPRVVLFDWHATLADTHDAMYYAVDDVIPRLVELNMLDRLTPPEESRSVEDAKLVSYVRKHNKLHPRISIDRKISRTDIFEVLFGDDEEAKRIAHKNFDEFYGRYAGAVTPFEPGARPMLEALNEFGLTVGIISNRRRDYVDKELASIEGSGWLHLTKTVVGGNEVKHRKPSPDLILKALENLGEKPGPGVWYVGDSTTDVYSAKEAGVTAVFYNGAKWEPEWIDKIFPATARHPHTPDTVVNQFSELTEMARQQLLAGEPEVFEGVED